MISRIARILNIPKRIWYAFQLFCNDIAYLFNPNKLFLYSWMEYKGAKMLHNNWGDDINKFFIEEISGANVKDISISWFYRLFPVKVYSCIGSILGDFPLKHCEVWGSGLIEEGKRLERAPRKIYSVRGMLTRKELKKQGIDCPEVYGDPALLISRYYRKSVDEKYQCGIIPHYIDEHNPALVEFCQKHPEYILIRMKGYDDWHDIPDQIMQCRNIISSSLHGLILADSYRVPNAWARFSNKIQGGDFKYLDYFSSVGRMECEPFVIKSEKDIERIIINNSFSLADSDKIDYRGIFEACPFKHRLTDYYDLVPQFPEYKDFAEKEKQYCVNEYIRTEEELDKIIIRLQALEGGLVFRGVCEARYKMYASSQRHWLQKSDWVARMGRGDYYYFVEETIRRTERLEEVQQYMMKQNVQTNDMFLMALMQHFNAPSPMIDFSENLLTGLFFASDWDNHEWTNSGNPEIGNYVSLYYISKHFDWVEASVQRIMQSAADNIEQMVSEVIADGITLDTKETEDDIRKLLYRQFRLDRNQSNITFIPLGGPNLGKVEIDIPVINFHCEYEIINDRIVRQQGMFIMNNTVDEPLVEVMNRQAKQKMFCCVNIHKKLLSYMRKKYLDPNNLVHDEVYENEKEEVKSLVKAIKSLN